MTLDSAEFFVQKQNGVIGLASKQLRSLIYRTGLEENQPSTGEALKRMTKTNLLTTVVFCMLCASNQ